MERNARVPVVILCGGMGTRLAEETETKPKPLVEIGGRPILWHIMKGYAARGFTDFVLCLGYKGQLIRKYFATRAVAREKWSVELVDTGDRAMTGARVKRIERHIDGEQFMLTYGDGVSNVDPRALLKFHLKHGRLGTVTGVRPPARFGELVLDRARGTKVRKVVHFAEKRRGDTFINGGFFVFSREFFKYLSADDSCVLERRPLERLSCDGELVMYRHERFWQCMDTMRDLQHLRELWAKGKPAWKTWR